MPIGTNLFINRVVTGGNSFAPSRTLPVDRVDFISVGVEVSNVSGVGASMTAGIQWSFDGDTWTNPNDDPDDILGTFTKAGFIIKRMPIKAPYYRVAAQVTGTQPTFTVTANALIWND
jgi:hypothetical protein